MAIYDKKLRKKLSSNPNVQSVTESQITYTSKFIKHALDRYKEGSRATNIWASAGFDISMFREGYFLKAIKRWQKQEAKYGKDTFTRETRGRKNGRSFASPEEEIAYLRAENEFLKKLRALEEELENE